MPSHSLDSLDLVLLFTFVDYFTKTIRTFRHPFLTERVMCNAQNCHMRNDNHHSSMNFTHYSLWMVFYA